MRDVGGAGGEPRITAVLALLHEAGLDEAVVTAAGHEREIAAVQLPMHYAERLAELAPRIKALGFRYVALDLTPCEELGE